MKAEAIKTKKLSVKQYLYKIMPYLSDLINDNKAIENNSNEWKIQTNIHVNFVSSNDNGEDRTIFVWSDNEEISRLGNETGDITKRLINSFLNNYLKEEIILRMKVILYLKVLIYCLIIFINKSEKGKFICKIF